MLKAVCFELDKNVTAHKSIDDVRKHLPKQA